ncbi:MAG: hypothetical protein GOMPHAMPRED_006289 [Gomphillus americanus]|uniref:Uncharacterized protein n=1 Tax=Gomphillus americanus TaxID=1940652 RepID=A0A8H3ER53_9LECA|nr:MAG: hypothetical protein GOMPHAMPRED_006289 [Gomphillus americanus]
MTILKRASYVCPEGQNIDIRGAEVTIIRKLGIKKTLRAATTGKEGVCFVDAQIEPGQNSQQTRLKDIYPNGRQETSKRGQKAGGSGMEFIFGDSLDRMEQDERQVSVRFEKDIETRSYDPVVGAGGLTRAMV